MLKWIRNRLDGLAKPGAQAAAATVPQASDDSRTLADACSAPAPTAEDHKNRGNAHLAKGDLAKALACYRLAIAVDPFYAEAHNNAGLVLIEQGQLEAAVACFNEAISLKPGLAQAHLNLGNVHKRQGRLNDAIASCRSAVAVTPHLPDAHNNLGAILQEVGRIDEAIACFRQAIALEPEYATAHYNLGNALHEQGRYEEAVGCYRRSLEIEPHRLDSLQNLGHACRELGKPEEAVICLRRAIALDPDRPEAHNYLGIVLHDQGQLEEAIACYRRALAFKPDYVDAHSNLLFCLNYHPDLTAEEIFAEYRRWNERHAAPLRPLAVPHANLREPQRRLRIGYVSPDLRRHSARHFIEPLLAHHDKTQVEVFAYAQVLVEDAVTARLKSYVDHWRSTVGLSDDAVATRIREDGVDILVDLAGHTAGNRLPVFARKPAPIQLSWMGYGYTTGLDAIDYFLADPAFAPTGCEPLFAEKLLRLPVFAAFRPAEDMGEPGLLPALQTGSVTFGTLTRSIRINHRVIRTWAAILARVPGSRLLVNSGNFRSPGMQQGLRDRFAACGIDPARLLLGFDSPPWDVMRMIDIGLDCFPHNSGTTLFESLYMGTPFVTLAGRPSVGRLGAAILAALGHPEWIATTEADYADKAVALASDLPALAALRAGLRQRMADSLLMNEPAFARSVETAFRQVWQQRCTGASGESR